MNPKKAGRAPGRALRLLPAATALFSLLALAACTGGGNGTPTGNAGSATGSNSAAQEPQVLRTIEGLRLPWSTVFLPDGTAIISERDSGELKSVKDGRTTSLGSIPGVVPGGEGGLLGLAVSPDYGSDKSLFAYFTAGADNRIARLTLTDPETGSPLSLGQPEIIFSGIPKASTHNGGRIRFGPDGHLYVGTGDSQRRDQPQDPNAMGGKILRITPEGRPAPGNPFGDNPVYSLGHRNVQGLDWDDSGRLWSSEFGPTVDDELNLIQPGGNYGWPEVTGAPGRDGFIDAKVVWPSTAESSPSGLEIVGSTAYLGALRGQRLWAVPLEGENAGNPVSHFTGRFGRIRDVSLAPDGTLWMLTNNQNPDSALILAPPGRPKS
ncbi:PQQ-dependent sugar dehydrogenase [Arthrobacter oryzae]|uniref:PQQ-dependent sugar dehydrogenase n=1 Tax=Arthrobacter oryzae TaxID=409290 RepID=UPI0028620124|nr:PQQ-dependent sugar dehydrogenase [Arthrobacter oryzae]MDR6506620.1 glucose/arabinose dehydrogenase [Arthrobacter oryzae]